MAQELPRERVADYLEPIHADGEYSVLRCTAAESLAEAIGAAGRELGLRGPLERWHEEEPRGAAGVWSSALHRAIGEHIGLLHAVLRALPWCRPLPPGATVQHPPRLRFRPPGSLGAEFHTDVWANNPADQLIAWVPLVDTLGEESLWLVPPAETRALDEESFEQAQRRMKAVASPLPLSVGEVLLMDASTGHGAPRHEVGRTRVSVDIRLSLSTPGPRAWRAADASVVWRR